MPAAKKESSKKRELVTVVYVDGQPYGPGPVDDEIGERITNPKAWGEGKSADADDA